MTQVNYYDILCVQKTDNAATIKKAYRTLAKKYHPDLNPGDEVAETKMREISEAFETLGNDEKRKQYDQRLDGATNKRSVPAEPPKTPAKPHAMTQEDFFNLSHGFDDLFSKEAIKKAAENGQGAKRGTMDDLRFLEHMMNIRNTTKK